jgi:hypothetical protein
MIPKIKHGLQAKLKKNGFSSINIQNLNSTDFWCRDRLHLKLRKIIDHFTVLKIREGEMADALTLQPIRLHIHTHIHKFQQKETKSPNPRKRYNKLYQ